MRTQSFTSFVKKVARLELTRGQRIACEVSFDGNNPKYWWPTDSGTTREIFGDVAEIPPLARSVIVWKKGARIGGTMLSVYRLLHLGYTVTLDRLAPGERAFGLIVAPDLRLARQGLRYIAGLVESTPDLKRRLVSETSDSITLRRDDGHLITFECLPATRAGSALRGRSLFGVLFTEAAFFRDENYTINDAELYKAVAPRIVPGGQLIIESTPWTEAGLLYDLYQANWGQPTTCIAAHCPTEIMRDDKATLELVSRERQRDGENAAREFDAAFMSFGSSLFFDSAAVDACVEDVA